MTHQAVDPANRVVIGVRVVDAEQRGVLRVGVLVDVHHVQVEEPALVAVGSQKLARGIDDVAVAAFEGDVGVVDPVESAAALHARTQVDFEALRKAEALTGGAKKAVDYVGFAKTVQQTAQTASKKEAEHEKTGIVENEDKLLAAYRLMQLTADRIGLVMCGDITAAVRALFLSTRRYRAALSVAENSGLAAALKQHDASGALVNQDVAIRLAAMCSFYLSDGYVKLREALTFPTSHA